jgi:hypothetical protein
LNRSICQSHSKEQPLHNVVHNKIGLEGFFKIEAIQPDGSRKVLADWFPNLITDIGLNRWGTGAIVTACGVGTGTAQPLVTDTGLQIPLAFTSTADSVQATAAGAAPYAVTQSRTFTFAQGAVVGNISEVSVGWATANGSAWSHARIKDGGGVDTTITVTAIEQLSVTYLLKGNIPSTDVTANVTIGGTATTVTIRAATATNALSWFMWTGGGGTALDRRFDSYLSANTFFYDGAIGPVTGEPSGTSQQIGGIRTLNAYVNNSLYTESVINLSISQANFAGGLDSIRLNTLGHTSWQMGFVPAIAKDSTKTFSMTFRTSWARGA